MADRIFPRCSERLDGTWGWDIARLDMTKRPNVRLRVHERGTAVASEADARKCAAEAMKRIEQGCR